METQEIWKDIPWYEWMYQVSNLWRVLSLYSWKEKILSPNKTTKFWHLSVWIMNKKIKVHRLVASCFLWLDLFSYKDKKTSLCVCHKDDNPANNRVDNLFLGTHKDNSIDASRKWRMTIKKWKDHVLSKEVIQIKDWNIINTFYWVREAERITWIKSQNISQCALWKKKSAWWFTWWFVDDKQNIWQP